jgi:peptide/nickel transport system permease protein
VTRYLVQRLIQMVPLLIGISLISYAVIRLAPGDPERLLADPERITAEQLIAVRAELGLDDPIPVQYVKTMKSLLLGDLRSFRTRQTVQEMIAERLPTTLLLAGLAITFGMTVGLTLGVVQALRPYSRRDDAGTFVSLLGFSAPSFWLAQMLILLFAVQLHWLPASGARPVDASGWNPLEMAPFLVLPTLVLSSAFMASVARYTRSSMLEALGQDYVRTAHAKGLAHTVVVVRHALRTALLPVITLVGFFLPTLIGGAAIVESIFALPGMGRLAVDSVFIRDYPVILTVNMLGATIVLIGSLLADVAYAIADPRIRYT